MDVGVQGCPADSALIKLCMRKNAHACTNVMFPNKRAMRSSAPASILIPQFPDDVEPKLCIVNF